VVARELVRREKSLEMDHGLTKMVFEIQLGKHTGDPVRAFLTGHSEIDLTE
jgi:hypothetical protein